MQAMEPTESQMIPTPQLLAGLTALLGIHGPFTVMTLGLYANQVNLTRQTILSDLTAASFTGYAAVAGITWSASYIDVDGSALALAESEVFIATGSTIANTIYGYYFTDAAVTNLLIAYALAVPVGIGLTGQAIAVVPFLRYSGN
jgi:hypothetical protein